jgi:hypothetical protein
MRAGAAERATKIVVLASTVGAIFLGALQVVRYISFFPELTLFAAVACYLLARRYGDRVGGVLLAAGYLLPLTLLTLSGYRYTYLVLWAAALLGAMAPTMRLRWVLPPMLRFALVAWALGIAVTWPIVAARSLDWNVSLFWRPSVVMGDTDHSLSSTVWISQVALVHLVGILWFEWLCDRFGREPASVDRNSLFERWLVVPALAAAVAGGLLTVYQGFFDLTFLSLGDWIVIGRATGQLADGNASGALNAMWVAIALAYALEAKSAIRGFVYLLGASLLFAAIYVTGSRTAMLCALIGALGIVGFAAFMPGRRRTVVASVGVLGLVAVAGWMAQPAEVHDPFFRIREVLPSVTSANIVSAARQLWDRGGYGIGALQIIREQPVQGVGVGVFHLVGADYYYAMSGQRLPADNAQNWFRHQLAELGVLGSVGWLVFVLILAAALLKKPTGPAGPLRTAAVKLAVIGFACASLLGMPSQNLIVALTIWLQAFWVFALVGSSQPVPPVTGSTDVRAAVMVAIAFAGATLYAGLHDLRPTFMAKRLNYYYHYGIYDSMNLADGKTQTTGHAVAVMAAPAKKLMLNLSTQDPDADRQPVRVQVWIDGELMVDSHFPRGTPLVRAFDVPGGNQRFVLETRVDRTYATEGRPEVGLDLEWWFAGSGT